MTEQPSPIDRTEQVADDLVRILDYLSRVCAAADGTNVHYLWDKAGALADAAQRLHHRLSQRPLSGGLPQFDPRTRIDPDRLRALVTKEGRRHRAVRALYPMAND